MPHNFPELADVVNSVNFNNLNHAKNWIRRQVKDLSKTLIIFDVEGCLLDAGNITHSVRHTYSKMALLNQIAEHELNEKELAIFRTLLLGSSALEPEEYIQYVCNDLITAGAKIIGLTSVLAGDLHVGNDTVNVVEKLVRSTAELKLNLYDFGMRNTAIIRGAEQYLSAYPVFSNGILCSNGEFDNNDMPTRGKILFKFLMLSRFIDNFKSIVYVGNSQENVHSVVAALGMNDLRFDVYGVHYAKNYKSLLPNVNMYGLIDSWKSLAKMTYPLLEQRSNILLEIQQTQLPTNLTKSKLSYLTTGSHSGIAQFTLAPNAKMKPSRNRDVEQLWVFKGELDLTIFRKGMYPGEIRIKDPKTYSFVAIPAGVHFKFRNNTDKPATFLIGYSPLWPGIPISETVDDFECEDTAVSASPKVGPVALTETAVLSHGCNVSVQYMDQLKNSMILQYTLKSNKSDILINLAGNDFTENIMIAHNSEPLEIKLLNTSNDNSVPQVLAQEYVDQYASVNMPSDTIFSVKNRNDRDVDFLILSTRKPHSVPSLLL